MTSVPDRTRHLIGRWRSRRPSLPGPFDLDGFRARADYGMEARSALLVISVENADAIADAAGPAVAKQLAADVCTAIGPHLRQTDLAAPISDDRVGVVMTELPPTDDQSLIEIADRMLHAIDQIRTSRGPQPVLRIGIAPAEAGILTHDLLQRAQQALEHGRVNQMRRAVAPITTSV